MQTNPENITNAHPGGRTRGRRIFALSDPHLSLSGAKPMDVFGSKWDNHVAKLESNWRGTVAENDIVLMPGDISWGMRLEEALPDLEWIAALPGRKVLLKGNHDYWWQSINKIRSLNLNKMYFIQNDAVLIDGEIDGGIAIAGTRLWDFPNTKWGYVSNRDNAEVAEEKRNAPRKPRDEDPEKIRNRELERLRLSLSRLNANAALRICLTHYPPVAESGESTEITDLISEFTPDVCVFGHVHTLIDRPHPGADIVIGGTRYMLAASDYLNHAPKIIAEI